MVKLKVTTERYEEVIDLVDSFDLSQIRITRAFEYLCNFVVDENGEYVGQEKGKQMFADARVKRGEIGVIWLDFIKQVNEAFVPKVNASD